MLRKHVVTPCPLWSVASTSCKKGENFNKNTIRINCKDTNETHTYAFKSKTCNLRKLLVTQGQF